MVTDDELAGGCLFKALLGLTFGGFG